MFWSVVFNVCLSANAHLCEWYAFPLDKVTEQRKCERAGMKRLAQMFPAKGKYELRNWYCEPEAQRINARDDK
jgi:hypothetical protein